MGTINIAIIYDLALRNRVRMVIPSFHDGELEPHLDAMSDTEGYVLMPWDSSVDDIGVISLLADEYLSSQIGPSLYVADLIQGNYEPDKESGQ